MTNIFIYANEVFKLLLFIVRQLNIQTVIHKTYARYNTQKQSNKTFLIHTTGNLLMRAGNVHILIQLITPNTTGWDFVRLRPWCDILDLNWTFKISACRFTLCKYGFYLSTYFTLLQLITSFFFYICNNLISVVIIISQKFLQLQRNYVGTKENMKINYTCSTAIHKLKILHSHTKTLE